MLAKAKAFKSHKDGLRLSISFWVHHQWQVSSQASRSSEHSLMFQSRSANGCSNKTACQTDCGVSVIDRGHSLTPATSDSLSCSCTRPKAERRPGPLSTQTAQQHGSGRPHFEIQAELGVLLFLGRELAFSWRSAGWEIFPPRNPRSGARLECLWLCSPETGADKTLDVCLWALHLK